jgi:hypothetical protein
MSSKAIGILGDRTIRAARAVSAISLSDWRWNRSTSQKRFPPYAPDFAAISSLMRNDFVLTDFHPAVIEVAAAQPHCRATEVANAKDDSPFCW